MSGFYARVTRVLADHAARPAVLLAALVAGAGLLSAVFSNDIICLAVTPVVVDGCRQRRWDPIPYLLGLAAAANVGSAATLIGNPQNMLIGQRLGLSFAGYLGEAGWIALLGLAGVWAVIAWQTRGHWGAGDAALQARTAEPTPFDRWQTAKGVLVAAVLLGVFLEGTIPREVAALAGAGVLLTSRRLHSRDVLGLVDWQLLVLFAGLFVVNHAFQQSGAPAAVAARLVAAGADPAHPGWLFAWAVLLSNAVSNVPAVMLLLPFARHDLAGPVLALASTLAGNLLIVGSIANIIVLDGAERAGVRIDWRRHARTGIPVTLVTLAMAAAGLWLQAR
jgi:Na+/H+ antiporter NhaD/arsenite permease-like protein